MSTDLGYDAFYPISFNTYPKEPNPERIEHLWPCMKCGAKGINLAPNPERIEHLWPCMECGAKGKNLAPNPKRIEHLWPCII